MKGECRSGKQRGGEWEEHSRETKKTPPAPTLDRYMAQRGVPSLSANLRLRLRRGQHSVVTKETAAAFLLTRDPP